MYASICLQRRYAPAQNLPRPFSYWVSFYQQTLTFIQLSLKSLVKRLSRWPTRSRLTRRSRHRAYSTTKRWPDRHQKAQEVVLRMVRKGHCFQSTAISQTMLCMKMKTKMTTFKSTTRPSFIRRMAKYHILKRLTGDGHRKRATGKGNIWELKWKTLCTWGKVYTDTHFGNRAPAFRKIINIFIKGDIYLW